MCVRTCGKSRVWSSSRRSIGSTISLATVVGLNSQMSALSVCVARAYCSMSGDEKAFCMRVGASALASAAAISAAGAS